MKKITFLFAFVFVAAVSFAQTLQLRKADARDFEKAAPVKVDVKAAGDVIWSEDFDGANWESTTMAWEQGLKHNPDATLPTHENGGTWNFVDNTDKNYFWHWSNHGPRGAYTEHPEDNDENCHTPANGYKGVLPEGTSVDNGFLLFESDYFNTTEACQIVSNVNAHDSYFEFGPIDFSAYPAVIFNAKVLFRICCQPGKGPRIQFSENYNPADGTGDWGEHIDFTVNTDVNSLTVPEDRDFYANVTSFVGGKSGVYFRLSFSEASHYFAMIDDIKFLEASANDIAVSDWWVDYMYDGEEVPYVADPKYNFWGGYTQIPQEVVSSFVKFRAAAFNNGSETASNAKIDAKIYKDDAIVQEYSGAGITLDPGYKDTLKVAADYTPTETGDYKVYLETSMDVEDEDPSNNFYDTYEFKVVADGRYSRAYHGREDDFGYASPANWVGGGGQGDIMAQMYSFDENIEGDGVTLKGLDVYISEYMGTEEVAAIENGYFTMTGKVWKDGEEITFMNIETEPHELEISDTGKWIYLPFKDQNLTVAKGENYIVGIETYTGNDELHFDIGTDDTNKPALLMGFCYLTGAEGGARWIITGDNYAIDLIIDNGGVGVSEGNNTFAGLSLYPNPINDELNISGLNSNIKTVIIRNVIGQTVMTVPAENASVISLADLNKGVYVITFVDAQNNVETRRIIKD